MFLDNLTDSGALGHGLVCTDERADDVTEAEPFHGWGTVVRHSWTTEDGEHHSRLFCAVTRPAAEWPAEIAEQQAGRAIGVAGPQTTQRPQEGR